MKIDYVGEMAAAQSPGGGFIILMVQNEQYDYGEGEEVKDQAKFEDVARLIGNFEPFVGKKVKITMELI